MPCMWLELPTTSCQRSSPNITLFGHYNKGHLSSYSEQTILYCKQLYLRLQIEQVSIGCNLVIIYRVAERKHPLWLLYMKYTQIKQPDTGSEVWREFENKILLTKLQESKQTLTSFFLVHTHNQQQENLQILIDFCMGKNLNGFLHLFTNF